MVQHRRLRRIFDIQASRALFDILTHSSAFRRELVSTLLRFASRRGCEGHRRPYLNIGHTGLNEEGFRSWVANAGVRPIYFVHDLIPLTNPEFCRAREAEKHRERMRTVVTTGSGVIANSKATLDELTSFARREQLASPPAIAALLGSDSMPRPASTARPRTPATFVILGTIEARKNHLMLLQLWSRLVQRLGRNAPRLLVIGQRGWECEQVFDMLDRSELLKGVVTEIGQCDDRQLADHLATARALLFPSLVEGFGLPLVEALQCGTPVIASDLPVFREIAGNIPEYLDPLDAPSWERTILSYAEDGSSAREQQLKRLVGFSAPSWKDHFAALTPWLSTL